ncbi:hypothetical protein [Spirillospora sp. NPDC047279]
MRIRMIAAALAGAVLAGGLRHRVTGIVAAAAVASGLVAAPTAAPRS